MKDFIVEYLMIAIFSVVAFCMLYAGASFLDIKDVQLQ